MPSAPVHLAPELLDRDAAAALLAALCATARDAEVVLDVVGRARLSAASLQVLLAARAEGRTIRLAQVEAPLAAGLATMGLGAMFTDGAWP